MELHSLFNTLCAIPNNDSSELKYYSLPALEKNGIGKISRLPVSIRIILESILRNYDQEKLQRSTYDNLQIGSPMQLV